MSWFGQASRPALVRLLAFILAGLLLAVWYVYQYGGAAALQQLINGLQRGSIYALIALGFTMVYGIVKLINFAGSALLGNGHFVAFVGALLISMAATALLGVMIERIAYRRLRDRPRFSALTTAMGVSLFLENFFALPPASVPFPLNHIVFGPNYLSFPQLIPVEYYSVGPIYVTSMHILDLGLALVLMVVLHAFIKHTITGKAMRAVAFNTDAAKLMGINVNRTIAITFAVGSALGAASGLMYGMTYGILASPYLGIFPGLQAFIAAVLGGIGSIPGAVLGGFLMGVSETLATSIDSNLGYMTSFLILIVVLLFRPSGLLGKFQREKV